MTKDTRQFVKSRIAHATNAELLVIKDGLRELLRHPIAVDRELFRDTKKLIREIDQEIEARYDIHLIEKRRAAEKKQPASASVVPLRNPSGVGA
ncbi:hypothetical protein [Acidithiobacillus caldus]|uniref:hypothetical protein n=1 Tax=Acidithiobacillus caldus TaxID=33059 RepID=UPI0013010807|nr:hypothetical protein [Acidithiobacillus caldus]